MAALIGRKGELGGSENGCRVVDEGRAVPAARRLSWERRRPACIFPESDDFRRAANPGGCSRPPAMDFRGELDDNTA